MPPSVLLALAVVMPGAANGAVPPFERSTIRITDRGAYPESVTTIDGGTVFAGSLLRPWIYRARPGARRAHRWIDLRPLGSTTYGVVADRAAGVLWACTVAHPLTDRRPTPLAMRRSTLRAFDIENGWAVGTWPLPGAANACNDVAVAPNGTVYVSDSGDAHRILRLRRREERLEVAFEGPEAERVDGLAFVGSKLYFASVATGRLFRLPLDGEGPARPVEVKLSRPLAQPDALRARGGILYVAESGGGRVSKITLSGDEGTVITLVDGLDSPTALDPGKQTLWFAELKKRLFSEPDGGRRTPFTLRSVRLDCLGRQPGSDCHALAQGDDSD